MKGSFARSGVWLVVSLVASALIGCGGGTGGAPSQPPPQFVLKPVGTSSNFGTFILGVDRSSIDANNADTVRVTARVLDPDGRPLGTTVTFQASIPDVSFVESGPAPTGSGGVPTGTAITDATGLAVITVKAGGTPGRLAIQAFTPANLDLGGVIFLNLTNVGFISGDLQIIPNEIDVTDPNPGTVLEFLVTGGQPFLKPDPPYILQNGSSGVGVAELLDDGSFPIVIRYTVSGKVGGVHTFSVIDAKGTNVTGTVSVMFSTLTIMPASATLVVGQTQAFALTGGVPPYTCTPSGGTLDPTTITERGGTTVFTAGDVVQQTTFTIVCTDVSGQIATATVTISPLPSPSPSSSGGGNPSPSPTPSTVTTIVVQPNPASINGVEGGDANIVATALDQNNNAISGVNILFTLAGQTGEPTATVPSVSPITAATNGGGQAVSVLTVPAGTAPQFLVVTASAQGVSGTGQVSVTSQRTNNPGPPARLNAALLKANGVGDNNDGTLLTILSALVTDVDGNPVADGVEVDWSQISPNIATVLSPTFTNGTPPCNVQPYESATGLAIVPQPGTALTCVIYPPSLRFASGTVKVTVPGTSLNKIAQFDYPGGPTPTPAPTPTPEPPPTPTP